MKYHKINIFWKCCNDVTSSVVLVNVHCYYYYYDYDYDYFYWTDTNGFETESKDCFRRQISKISNNTVLLSTCGNSYCWNAGNSLSCYFKNVFHKKVPSKEVFDCISREFYYLFLITKLLLLKLIYLPTLSCAILFGHRFVCMQILARAEGLLYHKFVNLS